LSGLRQTHWFSNGFHDTANAEATVSYTHTLKPIKAALLSGTMNFAGVLLGGVAVAFTLVELLSPEMMETPSREPIAACERVDAPDGNPAIAMLLAIFLAVLIWNVLQWLIRDRHLFEQTTEDRPPIWWVRACSFPPAAASASRTDPTTGRRASALSCSR
jgi:hypothetical protein